MLAALKHMIAFWNQDNPEIENLLFSFEPENQLALHRKAMHLHVSREGWLQVQASWFASLKWCRTKVTPLLAARGNIWKYYIEGSSAPSEVCSSSGLNSLFPKKTYSKWTLSWITTLSSSWNISRNLADWRTHVSVLVIIDISFVISSVLIYFRSLLCDALPTLLTPHFGVTFWTYWGRLLQLIQVELLRLTSVLAICTSLGGYPGYIGYMFLHSVYVYQGSQVRIYFGGIQFCDATLQSDYHAKQSSYFEGVHHHCIGCFIC